VIVFQSQAIIAEMHELFRNGTIPTEMSIGVSTFRGQLSVGDRVASKLRNCLNHRWQISAVCGAT
jgi:hypothetical protein